MSWQQNVIRRKAMMSLEELIKELPLDLQQEVQDFVEFLIEKRLKKTKGKFRFSWAGALKDLRDRYTSVELQKKALEWWGD